MKHQTPETILGWAYAYACSLADQNIDIRKHEAPAMLEAFKRDFQQAEQRHPQYDAVIRLLTALQAAGFPPTSVNDGGGEWEETPTVEAAADAITAVDEANIEFADPFGGSPHTAFIVLGNANSEMVCDHTDRRSEGGDLFAKTIDAFADAEEERE